MARVTLFWDGKGVSTSEVPYRDQSPFENGEGGMIPETAQEAVSKS